MSEYGATDNISAERGAESGFLRHVSKGKWTVGNGKHLYNIGALSTYCCPIKNGTVLFVGDAYGRTPEEALANARLMAASKDMAEALQKAKTALWKCSLNETGDCEKILDACAAVDAALKKASEA